MKNLKVCPFCKEKKVFIGVHDDEGNYHGRLGCEYEKDPWSGLCYALHHEGWGDCILCTDGADSAMGGVLFDTADEAAAELNKGAESEHRKQSEGEWVKNAYGDTICSNCGIPTNYKAKYCAECGVKMKRGAE